MVLKGDTVPGAQREVHFYEKAAYKADVACTDPHRQTVRRRARTLSPEEIVEAGEALTALAVPLFSGPQARLTPERPVVAEGAIRVSDQGEHYRFASPSAQVRHDVVPGVALRYLDKRVYLG